MVKFADTAALRWLPLLCCRFAGFALWFAGLLHPVEVALQSVQMSGPEPAERSQPFIQFLKRFRSEAIKTSLCIHGGLHKAGLAQHSQVLGYGRLRHPKLTFDLAHRLLGRDQQAQDRATVRFRNDFK